MKTINVQEAKTHLSRLMEEAMAGETIILGKHGKPMIKLVPFDMKLEKRPMGGMESRIWTSDDFDEEDSKVNQLFYGDSD